MSKDEKFFIVEEGIPIPTAPKGRYWFHDAARKVYPFEEMRVGDSFLAPPIKRPQAIKYAAKTFASRRGLSMKFEVRVVENGIRCWRIE